MNQAQNMEIPSSAATASLFHIISIDNIPPTVSK